MECKSLILAAMLISAFVRAEARGDITLGSAQNFAVLGTSTLTNAGPTILTGEVGVWPGIDITGFPPGIVVGGTLHAGDPVAHQAHNDLVTAYNALVAAAPTQTLTGTNLGGQTLTPGVYFYSASAQMTGTLTLNGLGNPNAVFVFQIGSTLTTATGASVLTVNGASGCNVYWQVGSSATLGTGTAFQGNILAAASVTLTSGATILVGSAMARDGAVTMASNTITRCAPGAGVCCRGATCTTSITSSAACAASIPGGTMAGATFAPGSACNSGSNFTSPCCYANYNKVNNVTAQDIFDFLNDWFAGSPFASVGGNGNAGPLTVQNIFDFLSDWFAGGCT